MTAHTVEGAAPYDAIADWYDESIRRGSLLHEIVTPALFELMGDVRGRHVCDLACGQGVIAREMAARGAVVTGIDISERLLEIARRQEEEKPQGIVYRNDDAQQLATVPDEAFDGVASCMALMDIPDLDRTFQSVRRVLRPRGWFVFAITHPCFQIPGSGEYWEERFWRSDNPEGVRGKVGAFHRPLSTYLNTLARTNFILRKVFEPQVPGRDVPPILALCCGKVTEG